MQAPAPTRPNTPELRYAAESPQFTFIKVEAVEVLPEPLLDPLSARIAYDENHTARIGSPIAGRVTRILVQPGDHVSAGQQLLLLDAPEYGSAAADVAKSRADFQLKQKAYARLRELFEAEVIARKEFESAESELHQAEAEHNRARMRLRNLDPAFSPITGGGYALRSPISGVVSERTVNPGSEVRPDAPNPLFVVTDPAHLWVIVDLPERNLGALHTGQGVTDYNDAVEHSVWLTMLRDRLTQVRDLLAPDGSVWVHLDDFAAHRARCVIDQVFGAHNFLATHLWASAAPPSSSSVAGSF